MRERIVLTCDNLDGLKDTYLWQYRESIRNGENVAGQELIMELDNLLEDLHDETYYYDTREAYLRMDFMENCLKLTKNPFYGSPFKLFLFQKAFIEVLYSFKMSDSRLDRFQRILYLIARKNGKSELCSALLLTDMFLGGKGRDIVCSSNDDAQADILYQACDTMRLMIDPNSVDSWRNQKWIKCLINDNKIFKLSDRTRNKEGRLVAFAVIDETHEMTSNVIVKSIEQSQSTVLDGKLILITTEGFVNDGFLDQELIRARGIIRGEIDDAASTRYLAWLYTQDSEQDVWNGNRENRLWMKSNPTLGTVKQWSYLEQQVDLAKTSKADRAFVFAKDFNIKQSNSSAWLMLEDYNYECVYDLNDFRGSLCIGGVDIAETTDLSCAKILLMKPNDTKKYIYTKYFIPEGKLERNDDKSANAKYLEWASKGLIKICAGNYTDPTIIADWFAELYREYGIVLFKCGYDIKFATDFLKRMDEYGFDTEIVYQRPEILNQAIKMVEADLKSRLISYNNNEVDRWCFGNTALKVDSQGNGLLVKIDGQHARKIDGSVALVITYEIFRRYMTDFKNNLQAR